MAKQGREAGKIRPRKMPGKSKGRPRGAFLGTFLRVKKVRTKSFSPKTEEKKSSQKSSPVLNTPYKIRVREGVGG